MTTAIEKSDRPLLEALRRHRRMSVDQLAGELGVTATAIRQRLDRLGAAGAVERFELVKSGPKGRGRPSYEYGLTTTGAEFLGHNMAELARVLWQEIREIENAEIREALLARVARRFGEAFGDEVRGDDWRARLDSLAESLRSRNVVVAIEQPESPSLPVLRINGCPYPGLAGGEQHELCEMEERLFSQLIGQRVELAECCCHSPDGNCTFVIRTPEREATPERGTECSGSDAGSASVAGSTSNAGSEGPRSDLARLAEGLGLEGRRESAAHTTTHTTTHIGNLVEGNTV